jgi:ketosteroid isomerase-like protein
MSRTTSTDIVMAAFAAVERRDEHRLADLYHPQVEFHWPPSLPYGGSFHGPTALQASDRTGFNQIWDPFQPARHERRMTRGSSPRPTRRSWCSGTSEASDRTASSSTWRHWASTGSATGSSPAHKCSTSTPPPCSAFSISSHSSHSLAARIGIAPQHQTVPRKPAVPRRAAGAGGVPRRSEDGADGLESKDSSR